jgi:diguanylate cyclase (GGDEF)-like protein
MKSRKMTIGIIAKHIEGYINGNIIAGVYAAAKKEQARIVAVRTMYNNYVNFPKYDNPLAMEVVDGWVVVNDAVDDHFFERVRAAGVPIVSVNRTVKHVPSIITDNFQGMYDSVEHMIKHGHRKIAFIGEMSNPNTMLRLDGYVQALQDYGIEADTKLVFDSKTFNNYGGHHAIELLLDQGVPFSAVVATSDRIGIGALEKLHRAGLRVPEDIALIGYNDIPYTSKIGMSTIFHPGYEMGVKSAQTVMSLIQGKNVEESYTIKAKLVLRNSCGCGLEPSSDERIEEETDFNYLQDLVDSYQEIGSSLLRSGVMNLRDISWMTNVKLSCLALWKEQDGLKQLHIDQSYAYNRQLDYLQAQIFRTEQFPPDEMFDMEQGGSDFVWISMIRTHQREWGLLALSGNSFIENSRDKMSISMMSHVLDSLAAILERDELLAESKAIEEQVRYMAYHDSLTGLLNRSALQEIVPSWLEDVRMRQVKAAIILLDLDRFKFINDSYGHLLGDQLLIQVAERLKQHAFPAGSILFRLGGDEFVVMLPRIYSAEAAVAASQGVIDLFRSAFHIGSYEFHVNCSLGISIFPDDGGDMTELIRHADMAMYRAKAKGSNQWELFHQEMNERTIHIMEMESGMRRALANQEFSLYYQPQMDTATNQLFGFEALIRWNSPERGFVPPMEFIPIAEETGLIMPIGEWVLREACRQMKQWQSYAGVSMLKCSVNISGRQFEQRDFIEQLRRILDETGLHPSSLCLEITESMAIHDVDFCISQLAELNQLGIGIALDDFGTGYSSLALLGRLPIQYVKIDRQFISNVTTNQADQAIVQAVVSLARSLEMDVIAEGVEETAQRKSLQHMGCRYYQGYLVSPPIPAQLFESTYLR